MHTQRKTRRQGFGFEKIAIAGALVLCLIMITSRDFRPEDSGPERRAAAPYSQAASLHHANDARTRP